MSPKYSSSYGYAFGDALYALPVFRWCGANGGVRLIDYEMSCFFKDLPGVQIVSRETFVPALRDVQAVYEEDRQKETSQYLDCWRTIPEATPTPFEFPEFKPTMVIKSKRPYLVIKDFGYVNGFRNDDLMQPDQRLLDALVDSLSERFMIVQVGHTMSDIKHRRTDVNLIGATTPLDVLSIVKGAAGVITRVGHLLPCAEIMNRPCLVVFSHRALSHRTDWSRLVTPKKLVTKPTTVPVIDTLLPRTVIDGAWRLFSE